MHAQSFASCVIDAKADRKVTMDEGKAFASERSADFAETSAIDNEKVREAFQSIVVKVSIAISFGRASNVLIQARRLWKHKKYKGE